ncbi:MAG: hypothetical protein HQM16_17595 [Deltaproteobacteria bacterium]|nr:hypothetical protein [Deltaproteobacteria bacterium]
MLKSIIIAGGVLAVAGGIYYIHKKTGLFKDTAGKIKNAGNWAKDSFKEGYYSASAVAPAK